MLETIFNTIQTKSVETGIESCWKQWHGLGAAATGFRGQLHSIVDIESLLIYSLILWPREPRLLDFVRWFCHTSSPLISIQRIKSIVKKFPPAHRETVQILASIAFDEGDNRWKRYIVHADLPTKRETKGPDEPDFGAPSSLMLRMRSGFGLGVKADLIAYLIGMPDTHSTIQSIADAISYGKRAVRIAAYDLEKARLIRSNRERPVRYYVPIELWSNLLELKKQDEGNRPVWYSWGDLYSFLAHASEWSETFKSANQHVAASRARDLFELRVTTLHRHKIPIPYPRDFKGPEFLHGMQETVQSLSAWISKNI